MCSTKGTGRNSGWARGWGRLSLVFETEFHVVCSQTHYVAKDNPKFRILLPLAPAWTTAASVMKHLGPTPGLPACWRSAVVTKRHNLLNSIPNSFGPLDQKPRGEEHIKWSRKMTSDSPVYTELKWNFVSFKINICIISSMPYPEYEWKVFIKC